MALLPLPKMLEKTQRIFNAWVRRRDIEGSFFKCISCGKVLDASKMQAGHFVPQKNSSYLRYNEDNVNGECQGCNGFDTFHLVGYRKNLAEKIGEKRIQYLEANQRTIKKWTRSELEFLIDKYKL